MQDTGQITPAGSSLTDSQFENYVRMSQPEETDLVSLRGNIFVDYAVPNSIQSSDPNQSQQTSLVSLGASHQTGTVQEKFNEWTRCSHVFAVNDITQVLNTILPIVQSKTPVMEFQFFEAIENRGYQRVPNLHWITSFKLVFSQMQGSWLIKIESSDLLYALNRYNKTVMRQGTVTEILQRMGEESASELNGLRVSCEQSQQPLKYVQSFESDYNFIIERLIPRALSERRTGDWRLCVKGSEIIFGPMDFSGRKPTKYNVYLSKGPVTEIEYEDVSHIAITTGGGGVRAVSTSPFKDEIEQAVSQNPDSGSGTVPTPAASPDAGAYPMRFTAPEDLSEVEAKVQNRYLQERAAMYRVSFSESGIIQVQIGDYINVVKTSEMQSFIAGSYYVQEINHLIEGHACTSSVIAARGETYTYGDTQGQTIQDPSVAS